MKSSAKVYPTLHVNKAIICGFKYTVEHPAIEDCVIMETEDNYFGYHDIRPRLIEIASGINIEQQRQTMWHEILEAIIATHDIDMDHQTLSTISLELYRMHVDNKWGMFNGC